MQRCAGATTKIYEHFEYPQLTHFIQLSSNCNINPQEGQTGACPKLAIETRRAFVV